AEAIALRAAIEIDHAAHGLARELKKCEACPVCGQTVATVPKRAAPKALAAADKAVTQSEKLVTGARRSVEKIAETYTKWARTVELKQKESADLAGVISKYPELTTITAQLQAIDKAELDLDTARDNERAAYDSLDQIRKIADEVTEREREARAQFSDARDRLVALGAPAAAGRDLAADWKALLAWAQKERPQLVKANAEAETACTTATTARAVLIHELEASCRECEIDVEGRDLVDAVAEALAQAKNDVERIKKALKDAEGARKDLTELQRRHDLANSLASHLSARGFEKWLVNEAVRRLVIGASEILGELSGDQYALTIDDAGNFLVIDHHNADEQRLARTLSGGETFLASLSLALALADQLAELAAQGAARLDAIFLDEGFGTLDPETLDTVAATVENLAARGRMVGVVTHVRELAERVPVQFRVKKDPRGSTIERVSA
ncbi:MAG TPA: SMC family ATPase, partial [Actinomycetota bacterium]|nr:SMC family ATPase [Actinomycetota bacterium]